jgi:hypothetical protein
MAKPKSGFQDLRSPLKCTALSKATASLRGIPMKDLLEAAFRCWQEKFGDDTTKSLMPPEYLQGSV